MSITRVVQLQFKPDVDVSVIDNLSSQILGMKSKCLDSETKKPYIESIGGGPDISVEGLQNGITHAFIIKFKNQIDRDYYALNDAAHQAVIQALQPAIEKVQIIDLATSG
ncbi:hypothetical protein BGZ61DRAFT_373646 [Ilyonectria robusta]|uniref:uncharacterized protein n=1 Tax=Ilyonectria robusta TaxID=1079257 RepID=UPI001E8EA841|nr:uncharacterized protein BGZ61DRAFT_373646 [Ilyonectria robusta]KAH8654350.1 hypothetical protein BGZ61DRAFT_373646 [Ilyonectria robusta]